jgi:hypothetical protein
MYHHNIPNRDFFPSLFFFLPFMTIFVSESGSYQYGRSMHVGQGNFLGISEAGV